MGNTIKLFISYSHANGDWLERVKVHLKPLVRGGLIDCWDDTRIGVGDRWRDEITASLQGARAAILLVSPEFYASDFIAEQELPPLLQKAQTEGTRILILVLDHCRFQRDSKLACFQAAHDASKPLGELSKTEQSRILDKLAATVEALAQRVPPSGDSASSDSGGRSSRPNPYDPRRPVVPPLFVGRQPELRQLGLALDRGESVSLVGDSRIGKSSLLKTWAIEARKRGREVREVNGKDSAGASIAAFVKAITGANAPNDPDGAAEVLNAWIGQQGPLAPLVLVDHARDVLRGFDARFWSRVRAMLDRSVWVFATAAEISEFKPDSPLMNRLKLMRLGLLEPAAAEALVAMGGFAADDGALMHEWAGRHPFYLQLLGQCLGDCETSRDALGRFTDEAEVRLQELWRAMEDRDRNTLKNLLTSPEWKKSKLANRGLLNDRLELFGQVVARWLENLE